MDPEALEVSNLEMYAPRELGCPKICELLALKSSPGGKLVTTIWLAARLVEMEILTF